MKSLLLGVQNLELSDRTAMYLLFKNYFKGVTWDGFQIDLERKNWVLLLRDETSNALKGFSTLMFSQQTYLGEQIGVVYSGDTIVDPSAWSSAADTNSSRSKAEIAEDVDTESVCDFQAYCIVATNACKA